MKWIVGVSIFVATALGFVATTTIPAATITPDEATLKYFPPETEAIGFVDVASLRDVPLVHDFMFQGPLTSVSPEIGGFVDSTGFDVRRDLDNVMIGRSGRDHIVHAAGFLPEAELSRLDIAGHALRGCPDEGELPIVNRTGPVHGDMIDPAPLHHLNQETSDSRPEHMLAHHENSGSVVAPSLYQPFC